MEVGQQDLGTPLLLCSEGEDGKHGGDGDIGLEHKEASDGVRSSSPQAFSLWVCRIADHTREYTISQLDRDELEFRYGNNESIQSLKRRVEERTGIPREQQRYFGVSEETFSPAHMRRFDTVEILQSAVDTEPIRRTLRNLCIGGKIECIKQIALLLPPSQVPKEAQVVSRTTGGGVIRRGPEQQLKESHGSMLVEDAASSGGKQEQVTMVADLRLVLVYGQWLWPLILFSGITSIDQLEDQWIFAMIGNALMLAVLWWISSAPSAAASTTEDLVENRQQRQQQLGRYDILPTVVWGIVPLLSIFLMNHPEAYLVFFMLVSLPFMILQVVRIKRYGMQATINELILQAERSKQGTTNRIAIFSENFVSYKNLEEKYFEELREQEDEESRLLKRQQEQLAYLEQRHIKIGKKKRSVRHMHIIFLLSALSFGSFLYFSNEVIPGVASATSTTVKYPVLRDRSITYQEGEMTDAAAHGRHSSVRDIKSLSEWERVLSGNLFVFVHFYAPWVIWCQRLIPTWEDFARETARTKLVVAQVNCVELSDLCTSLKISAFPTLRWYQNGKAYHRDYNADRTVKSFAAYAAERLDEFFFE